MFFDHVKVLYTICSNTSVRIIIDLEKSFLKNPPNIIEIEDDKFDSMKQFLKNISSIVPFFYTELRKSREPYLFQQVISNRNSISTFIANTLPKQEHALIVASSLLVLKKNTFFPRAMDTP